jgi:hypothetical protein
MGIHQLQQYNDIGPRETSKRLARSSSTASRLESSAFGSTDFPFAQAPPSTLHVTSRHFDYVYRSHGVL